MNGKKNFLPLNNLIPPQLTPLPVEWKLFTTPAIADLKIPEKDPKRKKLLDIIEEFKKNYTPENHKSRLAIEAFIHNKSPEALSVIFFHQDEKVLAQFEKTNKGKLFGAIPFSKGELAPLGQRGGIFYNEQLESH